MKSASIVFLMVLLTIMALIYFSCVKEGSKQKNYSEARISFSALKDNLLGDDWIRNPENLAMVHETFKKFGYNRILSEKLLCDSPIVYKGLYLKKYGKDLIDSLVLTYENYESGLHITENFGRDVMSRKMTLWSMLC